MTPSKPAVITVEQETQQLLRMLAEQEASLQEQLHELDKQRHQLEARLLKVRKVQQEGTRFRHTSGTERWLKKALELTTAPGADLAVGLGC